MARFLLGINYWPRSAAMYAWERFDLGEIREDMARIKSLNLDVVRFFLLWEFFQPHPDTIDEDALRRFESVMAAIHDAGLQAMPTLFCGHMSGVNWLPAWTLDPTTPHGRFRTISGGCSLPCGIGDFYADPHLLRAQTLFAHRVAERARDHPALYAWDLGNEFSNLREPATPQDAAAWSVRLTETLIEYSNVGATGGLHGEDIERDRHIRPSSIAKPWAFATMHGYPVYSAFARDRTDTDVVSFLMQVTESCSGKRVLFSELGNPQCTPGNDRAGDFACLDEHEMATYAYGAIDRLQKRGALGAFWWCWADYAFWLANVPPCDQAAHEMHFGIVRADGSFKPVAETLSRIASEARTVAEPQPAIVNEDDYYAALPRGIFSEYRKYCAVYR
jgi:endo-1,4-beta-mannosidase